MQRVDICVESVVHCGKKWLIAKREFEKDPSTFESDGITLDSKVSVDFFKSVKNLSDTVQKTKNVLNDNTMGREILEVVFEWNEIYKFSESLPSLLLKDYTNTVDIAESIMTTLNKLEDKMEKIFEQEVEI